MFITFEGIEGSGKSTQIERCKTLFESKQVPFIYTKEPGGTKLGQFIRQHLLDPTTSFQHQYTEVCLFIADRLEHVESIIKPALSAGKIVLCDRYKDSTLAYQWAGRQLNEQVIRQLNALTELEPDLTLLFDCPVEIGLKRAKDRAKLDRFEHEEVSFHERIYAMYNQLASDQPQRFKIINANASIDEVTKQMTTILTRYIKELA